MEMMPNIEDSTLLYEAAMKGCTTTLNTLIQQDKLILYKVSLTSFTETPLHISALLGHLEFTIAILELNPKMASELDSHQRSPLHLASAEGHTEIVRALLCVKNGVCFSRDQDGRIPLHLAAMRGRVKVIQELITAYPDSITELLDGDTVLHLCVRYNHLEALKLLIMTMEDDEDKEIVQGNQDGNTILHLSVLLKQSKTVRYLVSVPGVRSRANALNGMGFTALDVLEQSSRDFKSLEIQNLLIEAGARRSKELTSSSVTLIPQQTSSEEKSTSTSPSEGSSKAKSWFRKCLKYLEYDREETRGALMIVATVIATMTFQVALNPPGGVWQQNFTDITDGPCSDTNVCEAGTSVLAYAYPEAHISFLTFNSIAFVSSLSVISLILGGFPLRNKLCVWLLAQAITITVVFLALSYIIAIVMVTPSSLRDKIRKMELKLYWVWIGVLLLANVVETIRFVTWTVKKLRKCWHKILNMYRKRRLKITGQQTA